MVFRNLSLFVIMNGGGGGVDRSLHFVCALPPRSPSQFYVEVAEPTGHCTSFVPCFLADPFGLLGPLAARGATGTSPHVRAPGSSTPATPSSGRKKEPPQSTCSGSLFSHGGGGAAPSIITEKKKWIDLAK